MQIDEISVGAAADDLRAKWNSVVRRRAFLKGLGVAGAFLPAGALLSTGVKAMTGGAPSSTLTRGDVAILRFLAAAEILETDLWLQYNELGGVDGGNGSMWRRFRTSMATCPSTSPTTPTTRSATLRS